MRTYVYWIHIVFPLGIFPYLIGSVIIGLGVSYIYITTGIHATQSSFFSTTLSFFSKISYFQKKRIAIQEFGVSSLQ